MRTCMHACNIVYRHRIPTCMHACINASMHARMQTYIHISAPVPQARVGVLVSAANDYFVYRIASDILSDLC